MRFAFVTCQKWEDGFYNAYRHLAEEDLDLVLHLGDYVYEYGIDPATGGVRGVTLPAEYAEETIKLDQFRLRHALYKTDPDLQRAHARFPWVTTWDDHEVDNDYTADIPEDGMPPEEFRRRRMAAYQAFYEHLPLRSRGPTGPRREDHAVPVDAVGTWPSSTWSTPASSAATTRAATASTPAATSRSTPPRRCSASDRSGGSRATAPQSRPLEADRQPGDGRRARPRPGPRHDPLAGLVGRLPGRPPAAARSVRRGATRSS